MQSFKQQLALYQSSHTQRMTKATHFIGIPLVLFALFIILGWVHLSVPPLFEINLAWLGAMGLIIYYFFLDRLLAAGVGVILLLMTFVSQFYSQPRITVYSLITVAILLVIGIALQALGHFYENKKPVFLINLHLALVAPLCLFAEIMFALGYRDDLRSRSPHH